MSGPPSASPGKRWKSWAAKNKKKGRLLGRRPFLIWRGMTVGELLEEETEEDMLLAQKIADWAAKERR